MKFFSGFSLQNEQGYFSDYIKNDSYSIVGFSYGAIKALEEVLRRVEEGERVDTLQLLSPAFFQTKEEKFRRLQLMHYKRDETLYMKQFIRGCFTPFSLQSLEHIATKYEELEELLYYVWSEDDFTLLEEMGVKVEVYLGGEDKIIDVVSARAFFSKIATVTYIKKANHFLQLKDKRYE